MYDDNFTHRPCKQSLDFSSKKLLVFIRNNNFEKYRYFVIFTKIKLVKLLICIVSLIFWNYIFRQKYHQQCFFRCCKFHIYIFFVLFPYYLRIEHTVKVLSTYFDYFEKYRETNIRIGYTYHLFVIVSIQLTFNKIYIICLELFCMTRIFWHCFY